MDDSATPCPVPKKAVGEMTSLRKIVGGIRERACLSSLRRMPRCRPVETSIVGPRLLAPDAASFASSYEEIFGRKIYAFYAEGKSPRIVDCGANVGLSVLYFKKLHPGARITAFEADPEIARVLRENLAAGGAGDIEVVEAAVWDSEGEVRFQAEGADAGRVAEAGTKVRTVPLVSYLGEPVDFLKVDIEGAELRVLRSCRDELRNVRRLFVEYHSFAGQKQELPELLTILTEAGFRYVMRTAFCSDYPFVRASAHLGMDLQLNIFAFRPECVSST